jgi:hypothetical protein
MRNKRYKLFDDMRDMGSYATLKEVYDTGLIDATITYFYRRFSEEGCYINDNICVYTIRDQKARCLFLANIINRRAKLSPDTFKLDTILTRTVKELTGNEL